MNDPGDMLIVQMTQDKAREYSKQRIDRAIKNSPNLKLGWPTATNFSSTSYRYVAGRRVGDAHQPPAAAGAGSTIVSDPLEYRPLCCAACRDLILPTDRATAVFRREWDALRCRFVEVGPFHSGCSTRPPSTPTAPTVE